MNQIYHEFISAKTMKEEMERCESCLEKPCMSACPAQCSPADFIRVLKGQGRLGLFAGGRNDFGEKSHREAHAEKCVRKNIACRPAQRIK